MILIGLGANLPTERYGPPEKGLSAALQYLAGAGVSVARRSRWYRSAPLPPSDQPWYINGVAAVETEMMAPTLLALLLRTEGEFGRVRSERLDARALDLDLLDYDGRIVRQPANPVTPALTLPHPRMTKRAFVLLPLAEVAPDWSHPESGAKLGELVAALPQDQAIELL